MIRRLSASGGSRCETGGGQRFRLTNQRRDETAATSPPGSEECPEFSELKHAYLVVRRQRIYIIAYYTAKKLYHSTDL